MSVVCADDSLTHSLTLTHSQNADVNGEPLLMQNEGDCSFEPVSLCVSVALTLTNTLTHSLTLTLSSQQTMMLWWC